MIEYPLLRRGEGVPYLQDSVAHLEIFEGIVPWMYLDTNCHRCASLAPSHLL
jgi:hypothetical protein